MSNQKTYTTLMKAGLQSGKRKQGGALSMLISVKSFKQNLGGKSGLQWWSAFVPTEASFPLSSFSKRKIYQDNGFQRAYMAIGGLIAIQRDGQVTTMVWIGSKDVLILKHASKQRGNIVFSFATDTIATLLPNS